MLYITPTQCQTRWKQTKEITLIFGFFKVFLFEFSLSPLPLLYDFAALALHILA